MTELKSPSDDRKGHGELGPNENVGGEADVVGAVAALKPSPISSNPDPLHLIERNLIAAAVIEPGGSG